MNIYLDFTLQFIKNLPDDNELKLQFNNQKDLIQNAAWTILELGKDSLGENSDQKFKELCELAPKLNYYLKISAANEGEKLAVLYILRTLSEIKTDLAKRKSSKDANKPPHKIEGDPSFSIKIPYLSGKTSDVIKRIYAYKQKGELPPELD